MDVFDAYLWLAVGGTIILASIFVYICSYVTHLVNRRADSVYNEQKSITIADSFWFIWASQMDQVATIKSLIPIQMQQRTLYLNPVHCLFQQGIIMAFHFRDTAAMSMKVFNLIVHIVLKPNCILALKMNVLHYLVCLWVIHFISGC